MNKGLIVIDVQKHFSTKFTKSKVEIIVSKLAKYLAKNHKEYKFIYFTIFRNDKESSLWQISHWYKCVASPDTDLFDQIKPYTNKDNIGIKNFLSAAKMPQINKLIKQNKISEIDLCGFDTDCCLLATAYDLFDLHIKPVILENLSWSTSKDNLHSAALKIMRRNIGFVEKVKL